MMGDVNFAAEDEDDLTDDERELLHRALAAALKSAEEGRGRPADEVLKELRNEREQGR